jgi:hypothetical protein
MSEQGDIHTVELTDDELKLIRAALHSFLDDFTYVQKDIIIEIKALLTKLPGAGDEEDTLAYGSSRPPAAEGEHRLSP